ncbi:MAG TPA: cytochrome c oxidase subunit 4 [Candidatus Limnocylindrales bacterium]|nr:cytochrome c oxidase subunit 4 [Candidatus Limnocylindrales bacterium]
MIEEIWNGILEFTARFVIPDWGSVIAMLPVVMAVIALLFFGRVAWAWATAGPTRRGGGRRKPVPPPGVHMPGPSYAPIFAGIGAFLLFLGLVFGGLTLLLGVVALTLTLLYWGREALVDYDRVAGEERQLPAVVHEGPPPGVHMPGPSFRPILISLALAVLFAGLVFGGWVLGVGVILTIVTLLGWLNDARKEYRHVEAADRIGHLENEPAPGWPKRVLLFMALAVVAAVVLDAGWFPPRSAGAGEGEGGSPPPAGPSAPAGQITIVAEAVKFDVATLNVPADTAFKLALDNRDPGTPHDVDILAADGSKLFDGPDFPGIEVRVYDVPPIPAGTYPFICSIHPDLMKGELIAGT